MWTSYTQFYNECKLENYQTIISNYSTKYRMMISWKYTSYYDYKPEGNQINYSLQWKIKVILRYEYMFLIIQFLI